jgi:m7GpppX diphosphatase
MAISHQGADYSLFAETPKMYCSSSLTNYVAQEVVRPSKQWITNIIEGSQEKEKVIYRDENFVLLPDTERVNRYSKTSTPPTNTTKQAARQHRRVLNWLAIAHDRNLRTIRDLRGEHIPFLKQMLAICLKTIHHETGIKGNQVMAYFHYPPSVYQLHVHFSYPYGQYCHRDAYRVHNLSTVINNLEIDPLFYRKAELHMAIFRHSPLHQAIDDYYLLQKTENSHVADLASCEGSEEPAGNTAP